MAKYVKDKLHISRCSPLHVSLHGQLEKTNGPLAVLSGCKKMATFCLSGFNHTLKIPKLKPSFFFGGEKLACQNSRLLGNNPTVYYAYMPNSNPKPWYFVKGHLSSSILIWRFDVLVIIFSYVSQPLLSRYSFDFVAFRVCCGKMEKIETSKTRIQMFGMNLWPHCRDAVR